MEYNNNQNQTPQGSNNAGNTIGWLEKILALEAKYGIKNIINGFLILFIAIMMGVVAFNPTFIFQQIQKAQETRHKELIEQRKKADPQIKSALIDLRSYLSADRAVLFETHNGGSNLTGLPFLYVDMTYDEPRNGLMKVIDEYKNVSQTRYNFMNYVYANNFWFGSIEEIKELDIELYYRLQNSGVTYAGFMVLYGSDLPSGALGIIYTDENDIPEYSAVRQTMYRIASQIILLIDATDKKTKQNVLE